MYISARERQILEYLISHRDGITVKKVAEEIQVSERTVHRDLKGVEDVLAEYAISLKKQAGVGVQIIGDENNIKDLEMFLFNSAHAEYTPEERQTMILSTLLEANEPIKLASLAIDMNVTVATISHDLDKLNAWLSSFDLELIRRRGYGVEILGTERSKRKAMSSLIVENWNEGDFLTLIRENIQKKSIQQISTITDRLLGLVEKEKLVIVEKAIEEVNNELPYPIADSAYIALVVHLALAIERILQGEKIEIDAGFLENLKSTREYEAAKKIISKIEKIFHITIPVAEVGYITMHLRGAKLRNDREFLLEDTNFQIALKVRMLIKYVGDKIGRDLNNDQSLFQGLVTHLKPAIYRIRQNMGIYNPLLEKIKIDYAELFVLIKEAAEHTFDTLRIPDSEIGFLVMHFGSVLEKEVSERNLSALIICSSGIGTSKMLATRIKQRLPEIKHTHNASLFELKNLDINRFDVVISTIPMTDIDKEYILVNPFLTEEEVAKIYAYIQEHTEIHANAQTTLTEKSDKVENKNIKKVITSFSSIREYSQTILSLLEGFNYFSFDHYENIHDVISQGCYNLYRKGVVQNPNKVVEALFVREKLGAIGIPDTSMALFHARTEDIQKPSFTIYSIRPTQIKAMDDSMIQVKNILLLLAPENISNEGLELLSLVSSLIIESEENISLFESQSPNRIASFLSLNFDNFFDQKLKDIRRK